MTRERKVFLQDQWLKYPAFPPNFDSSLAQRFMDLEKMPWAEKIQLSPAQEKLLVSKVEIQKILSGHDWVVAKMNADQIHEIFLLAPSLEEPLYLKSRPEVQKKWFEFLDQVKIFFVQRKFQQAQTPTIVDCPGTEPFLDLFSTDMLSAGQKKKMYLVTSPELHLKKMLASGYRNLFEIKNCYRNGETSERHTPEFHMLEWYRAFVGLEQIIQDSIELIEFLQGKKIKFQRKTMADLFSEKLKFKLTPQTGIDELKILARSLHLKADHFEIWDDVFYFIFVEKIEPFLDSENPVIVEKYPPSQAAFARLTEDGWGERFEIYWKGLELGNAFHELNDPDIQAQRFKEDLERKAQLGKEIPSLDIQFMQTLRSGMPPAAGIAVGLERLFMALNDIKTIQELKNF